MTTYNDTALQILEAAKTLFSEQGFKATSTKKVAQAAQVNEVTIFRLFGSKAKLFDAVIEEFVFRPNFKNLLQAQAAPLPEFLTQLGYFLQELMSKNVSLIKIEIKHPERMKEQQLARFPKEVKQLVGQQFMKHKGYSQEQAMLEAVCFMTALHGLCLNLYIFQTVTQGVSFEPCLKVLVEKFSA